VFPMFLEVFQMLSIDVSDILGSLPNALQVFPMFLEVFQMFSIDVSDILGSLPNALQVFPMFLEVFRMFSKCFQCYWKSSKCS